jgi:hypothetical protein
MNIFAFDPDPWTCALWLDDVRKNKMILETAQLLSAAVAINDPSWASKVYKPTHLGHPCAKWTMASRGNFNWLRLYLEKLAIQCSPFSLHKSLFLLPTFDMYYSEGWFPSEAQTPFPNCAANADLGISFKHVADVHEAYRLYICERWKRDTIMLTWIHGEEPPWRSK